MVNQMTNEEIVTNLRLLAQGETVVDASIKDILASHNCTSLAQKVSVSAQDKLSQVVSSIAVKERYKHAKPLFDALQFHEYAVIKGAVLSNQIYSSPFIRHSGDLDILIHRHDLDYVKQVLLNNGFVQGRVVDDRIEPFTRKELIFQASQSHQTAPFVKETGNKLCPFINFDLNTSVYWGEYDQKCNMDLVLSEVEETSLLGYSFKKLSPEMEFISLCLHHYKDMNSIYLLAMGNLQLSLFCDIFYYLKNTSLDIDKLYSLSTELNALPYVYYCIWYTDMLFKADFLQPFIMKFKSPEGILLLRTFGLCDQERHEWRIDFYDRLFSPSFRTEFYSSLSEKERDKIKLNRTLM